MEKISIGDRIELKHIKSKVGVSLDENKYGSQLVNYDEDKLATITMPIYKGRVISLQVGDEYTLSINTKDGFQQCNARILKRYVLKSIYLLDVVFISPLKRSQRRKYYRLDCLFEANYRLVSEYEKILRLRLNKKDFVDDESKYLAGEELLNMKVQWDSCLISDISGGGVCFHSKQSLNQEDELELDLSLPMDEGVVRLKLMFKVIACTKKEENRFPYEIRGEYVGIDNTKRELIVRYVFQEQRKRLGKL